MLSIKTKTEINDLHILDCGLADYHDVLARQHQLRDQRQRREIPNTILLVEHRPVITLGARQSSNKLIANPDTLKKQNIDVIQIRRGGGVTAHNPGQLVFYPILNLQDFDLAISDYIRELESIGAELLEQLGLKSQRKKGLPGLWINEKKIASIGVRVAKSVTYHGMAINIANDLSIFDLFVPCGLDGVEITSVEKQTHIQHSMADLKKKLTDILIKHFSSSDTTEAAATHLPKLPPWLRRPLPASGDFNNTEKILNDLALETICTNANCPNRGQCWDRGTATALILGNICTRNCKFCSVSTGKPAPPDPTEPARIARMAEQMNLKYLVITSVNRDDLPDGGAAHFRDCITQARLLRPDMKFEILTPDFRDCQSPALETLKPALPFVFAHNVETVPSLYPTARAGGDYRRSLALLKLAKEIYPDIQTKSSIMLGLGETDDEIETVLKDLRHINCDRVTIGQYLRPSKNSLEVIEYITPEKFDFWKQKARKLGFSWVISSPFARSSYFAEQQNTP